MTDYLVGDTLYFMFTTRQFSDGVPTVLAGSPVVSAYENDSATQITAGITLGVSHDSVVGMNLLTIVATGANGYEAGKDYNLAITTGTVGGVSVVGEVVATFSLGRSAAAQDLANGTDGLGALKTVVDTLATTADLLDKLGAVNEAAAAGDPSATESVMQYVKQIVNMIAGAAGIATMPAAAAPANGVSLVEMIRATYDDTNSLDATKVPDTLSLANINAEVDTALNTAIPGGPTAGSVNEAIARLARSAATIQEYTIDNTSFTATTTAAQVDAVDIGSLEATDDHFNGRIIIFTSGALIFQATDITDYDGTNKRFTYTALTEAPADDDTFIVV